MKKEVSGIVLTAAKADITICEVFGDLPTGLIPVNGKPIIFFILQQFIDNDIKDVYIGVDYKDKEIMEVVDFYFSSKLNIKYIFTDRERAPGNSLLSILNYVKTQKVVVNLGDTFIKDLKLNSLNDKIIVSKDFLNVERWSTVKIDDTNNIKCFQNKEKVKNDNIYAICGLYVFNDIEIFESFQDQKNESIIDIVALLEHYHKNKTIKIQISANWLDFGHIDKYYTSKKRLIQSRGFNTLEYNDLLGTITKKSKNVDKFLAEIGLQVDLPSNIQVLAPRILRYSLGDDPFIEMELYSYPTIAEIWLFSELNEGIYFSMIDKIFKILGLFKENKQLVMKDDYRQMYVEKTLNRIEAINNQDILKLLTCEILHINGNEYKNWNTIKDIIINKVDDLYNENDNCFIHGDFCLSNILYDLRSGILRVIDPRGIWGSSENGDIKYDIAKLRHSICGDYDYIVNDLFKLKAVNNFIEYDTFNINKSELKLYFDQTLSKDYDIKQIKLIEGLLFLSMISLHSDNEKRQIVMYAKSIELLNDVIK